MNELVCLSYAPWQVTPTRTQHLLSRMRDAQVLFFEPAHASSGRTSQKPGKKVRPGVLTYTLPTAHTASSRLGFLARRDLRRQANFIQTVLQRHEFRSPVLWATAPTQLALAEQLAYRGLVYDCHRYWAGLPPETESDMALAADVIFAASGGLADRLAPCNKNIALLPNGANYPMFSRSDLDLPPCIAELKGAVLGFSGTIRPTLDLAPLIACAQAHPEWTILLLGRIEHGVRLEPLQAHANIWLLGQRPLVDVPDFVARFNVCLDLRDTSVPGDDVIPVRVYEYLAAGRPVVSMYFKGQIPELPDVVYAAYSPEEFVAQCERAMMSASEWVVTQRRDRAAAAAWSVRAETAMGILAANGLYQ